MSTCDPFVLSRRRVLVGAAAQTSLCAAGFSILRPTRTGAEEPSTVLHIDIDKSIDQLLPATPEQARTMAARAVGTSVSIAQTCALTIKQLKAADSAIFDGTRQISELQERKKTVIAQLRSGFYCSQCRRSKIEIEAQEKEDFDEHLRKVNGRKIPASDALVQQKAAEFDQQIALLHDEQDLRRRNRDKHKRFNESLQQQFNAGIALWQTAIRMEHGLLQTQFGKKSDLEEKRLAAAKSLLQELQRQELSLTQKLQGKDRQALARLQQNQDEQNLAGAKIDQIQKDIAARKRNYEDSKREAESIVARETRSLSAAATEIGGREPYHMPNIPSISILAANWKFDVSNEQTGTRFKFNKVIELGLEANFDRAGPHAESVAFIELLDKVKVFAGSSTDLKTGRTIPIAGFEIRSEPTPDLVDDEAGRSESWKIELPRP